MSDTKSGLHWDDDEVTSVDAVCRLPMTDMQEQDKHERSRKNTVRIKPIRVAPTVHVCDENFHATLRSNPVALLAVGMSPTNGRRWFDDGEECLRVGCCPLCTTSVWASLTE